MDRITVAGDLFALLPLPGRGCPCCTAPPLWSTYRPRKVLVKGARVLQLRPVGPPGLLWEDHTCVHTQVLLMVNLPPP
eukprot:10213-Prorocentrum_minimum.AAC.1